MSQSMKTTKGLFLKSTSELTQSLSSLHTAGIHVGGGSIDWSALVLRDRGASCYITPQPSRQSDGDNLRDRSHAPSQPPQLWTPAQETLTIPPSFQTCFVHCLGTNQMEAFFNFYFRKDVLRPTAVQSKKVIRSSAAQSNRMLPFQNTILTI